MANEKTVFETSYAELLPEFRALEIAAIVPVNLDPTSVATTILGASPEIVRLEAELSELPEYDADKARRLDVYAMALSHAQTLYTVASEPPNELAPWIAEGTRLRELLLGDASQLALRGLMNGAALETLNGPVGFKNVAKDLQILAALFRASFPQIQGKCATTEAELSRADELAAAIMKEVGLKEQGTADIADALDIRNRAFSVVTALYDQVRRAVSHLRWNEGDVDDIAPSLFSGKGARKRGSEQDPAVPVSTTPATEVTPKVVPNAAAPPAATPAAHFTTDPFLS